MSLQPTPIGPVPDETARVAHAAFPTGNMYVQLRDELGRVYDDANFSELFPTRGQPAEVPWRLALVTVLQFAEGLSDRQAADAVRGRIDWKYLLGLDLTDPGFDHTVLSEFRSRLVAGHAEVVLLDALLARSRELGLFRPRGRQRTDSTHVLAAVRVLNRLERVGETLRAALNSLAVVAPDWLQSVAPPAWYQRYGSRVENYDLPKSDAARRDLAATIAADGQLLLNTIDAAVEQPWLNQVPTVRVLRQVWAEQFVQERGRLRWREVNEIPIPAEMISSPYDPEARYSSKRSVEWVGYKVHLTETCDADTPHLITNVESTPASRPDDTMLAVVHGSLAAMDRLPAEHLVDKGYTDSHVLVDSRREYGVSVIGPVADDPSWQAQAGSGFAKGDFIIDWDARTAICPSGKRSFSWLTNPDATKPETTVVRFSRRDCSPCPVRTQCTRRRGEPRELVLQPRVEHEALWAARRHQQTDDFKVQYAARAGVEGTHAQAVRRAGLRRSRYIGLAKTRLQHIATAAAVNLVRINEWCSGTPLAKTRVSRFAALQSP
ncbi:MAG: IS1182 family transposase [Chloroflexi bacterium]|nr:IS1182 family transposase [Chloroflexota bacterium]MBV9545231.1 IS1182 family transposase [Chloroflexota bacterium]